MSGTLFRKYLLQLQAFSVNIYKNQGQDEMCKPIQGTRQR
jgi:hypothetical protein